MVEKTKKDVLIIGAGGLLGKTLVKEIAKAFSIHATTKEELDITDRKKVQDVCERVSPRIIILAAAYTDVDGCEKNPDLARRVNIEGTRNIAESARKIKADLIFISSDYVFDGETDKPYRETDRPNPVSVYGQTKFEGERAIESVLEEFVIIRSSWLFGEGEKGFVQSVLKAIRNKKPLQAVEDKIGSPTYVVDLASAVLKIVSLIAQGQFDFKKNNILHIVNGGNCSWYDIAKFILGRLHVSDVELKKMRLVDYPFLAHRPRYSALDNTKCEKIIGMKLRSWQESLGEFVSCQKI